MHIWDQLADDEPGVVVLCHLTDLLVEKRSQLIRPVELPQHDWEHVWILVAHEYFLVNLDLEPIDLSYHCIEFRV